MNAIESLPRPAVQRLEAWVREVTDLLCYQPEVPLAHKTALVEAMQALVKELEPAAHPTPPHGDGVTQVAQPPSSIARGVTIT